MSALLGIAESLIRLLDEGGAKDTPVMDIVVECLRSTLRDDGMEGFLVKAKKTFDLRVRSKRKAAVLYRRFARENKTRLAELTLVSEVKP